jgi:hypothetical protein
MNDTANIYAGWLGVIGGSHFHLPDKRQIKQIGTLPVCSLFMHKVVLFPLLAPILRRRYASISVLPAYLARSAGVSSSETLLESDLPRAQPLPKHRV